MPHIQRASPEDTPSVGALSNNTSKENRLNLSVKQACLHDNKSQSVKLMELIKDNIYHIYNQGNNRQKIFYNRDNYGFFLQKMVGLEFMIQVIVQVIHIQLDKRRILQDLEILKVMLYLMHIGKVHNQII